MAPNREFRDSGELKVTQRFYNKRSGIGLVESILVQITWSKFLAGVCYEQSSFANKELCSAMFNSLGFIGHLYIRDITIKQFSYVLRY